VSFFVSFFVFFVFSVFTEKKRMDDYDTILEIVISDIKKKQIKLVHKREIRREKREGGEK